MAIKDKITVQGTNIINSIIIFKTEDEKISIDVRFGDETLWHTIDYMAKLFEKSRSTINEHILNIYAEKELEESDTARKIGISDFSTKPTNIYSFDVIILVGYRVKSLRGTQFRQWATKRLNEYICKGFTMDDERLKNLGGGSYWKEFLQIECTGSIGVISKSGRYGGGTFAHKEQKIRELTCLSNNQ
ncbi:MAG: virulence RhuM family protein [Prevotellaceae bacterium]|jgi:hypothetical protein|nr:virulence RhuM family protein [Prevotellaceae bacterium]